MQTHRLRAHPERPPLAVTAVEARVIGHTADWLRVRWRVEGSGKLVVPPFAGRGRADELWRTTCFELFLRPAGGSAYSEFNLSPSERWAAYDFASYREGMAERPASREPDCVMRMGSTFAIFDAAIPAGLVPAGRCEANFAAVVEEEGGIVSYWALAHPAGQPDFHDPACFVAEVGPPAGA